MTGRRVAWPGVLRVVLPVVLPVVTVVLAVAGVLVAVFWRPGEPPAPVPPPGAAPEPPPGWRWEAYGGAEVQVPAGWGYGTSNTPPCLGERSDAKPTPYVGRPGNVPLIGCSGPPVPPRPQRVPYLWFNPKGSDGVRGYDGGWVEETRTVAGTAITVFTDDAALRARILGSARPAGASGCPTRHPATDRLDARPDPRRPALAEPVDALTLCRYTLDNRRPGPAMLSASRLTGAEAAAVVRAILAAPPGSGPDSPENCAAEYAHGDELMVLTTSAGHEVYVRYSGCVDHGFDDGHTRHRLTADAIRPLLAGPHSPTALVGPVADLAWPSK